MSSKIKIIVILGPTASGKSKIVMELAAAFNAEIVSADSMQVYRFMDIGTAKPSIEDRKSTRHHMIDIVNPDEEYTAAKFKDDAARVIEEIHKMGRNVFVVGGTGLYIRALVRGLFKGPAKDEKIRAKLKEISKEKGRMNLYNMLKKVDPASAERIHPNNEARIIRALEVYYSAKKPLSAFQKEHGFFEKPYETLLLGILKKREALYRDIDERVERMIEKGLVDEVRQLIKMGYPPELKPMQGLGYKEANEYLKGEISFEKMMKDIKINTRRYAKRQITWFRKEPDVNWIDADDREKISSMIKGFLNS